jgi:hypothetical protein
MRKTLFALGLLAVIGVGAYRFLSPPTTPRSPVEKLRSAVPPETMRAPKPTQGKPFVAARAPIAENPKKAQWEERFDDLKEEGRRMRQALMESDPRAAKAYAALAQRPDYRQLLDRRHQIEAEWAKAPDDQRDAMLAEMNSLRQQGVALILAEIARTGEASGAGPASGVPQVTNNPAIAAPPAAPSAPPVFE